MRYRKAEWVPEYGRDYIFNDMFNSILHYQISIGTSINMTMMTIFVEWLTDDNVLELLWCHCWRCWWSRTSGCREKNLDLHIK